MKKLMLIVIAIVLLISPMAYAGSTGEKGFGLFYGRQVKNDPIWHTSDGQEWSYFVLHPTYGWRFFDKWKLYLEGDLGSYYFDGDQGANLVLGVSGMLNYDFYKFKSLRFFVEGGGGIGYWSSTPSENFVGDGILGNFKYGFGVRIPVKRKTSFEIAYRFTHYSAIGSDDSGANTSGVRIAIVW